MRPRFVATVNFNDGRGGRNQRMQNSGIRFTLQEHYGRFLVRLGDYRHRPDAEAILPTREEAVSWLREQVKVRYPESV